MLAEAGFRRDEPGFLARQKPLEAGLRWALPHLPPQQAPLGWETPLLSGLNERPCPRGRQTVGHGQAIIVSGSLHAAMFAAAMTMMPGAVPNSGERGGLPDVMAVILVGEAEILARDDGSRNESTVMLASDSARNLGAVPPDPVANVHVPAEPPVESIPNGIEQAQAMSHPVPEKPTASDEVGLERVVNQQTPPRTPITAPRLDVRKKPAKQKSASVPKARPERRQANGRHGKGLATVTQPASQRGGTGGAAQLAGTNGQAGYSARLRALIERQKMYPEQAQERGQIGRTTVRLVVARDGRLEAVQLVQGSGHALLDAATMAAIRRAQPFPAMAEGAPPTASFTLALSYALN